MTALLQADGAFAFRVPVLGFRFEKALMEEHFNENYLESHTYPNGSFEGSIAGFDAALQDGGAARCGGQGVTDHPRGRPGTGNPIESPMEWNRVGH